MEVGNELFDNIPLHHAVSESDGTVLISSTQPGPAGVHLHVPVCCMPLMGIDVMCPQVTLVGWAQFARHNCAV
jgi:hypothetical protein